ncbi:hypothetical protein [Myxococcus sp. RHSTA-1-4]|uniref:hypothetical protein n=1 Tax=Myxococcus sp. RHSTA-1-4 TaxID=2874601 RepID=UPI001CBEBE91|nr:hypothetical protein [Myxococcus sp. RHSTA-1-4]
MRIFLLAALAVSTSACMLNPVDGQTVSSTTGVIDFLGYSNTGSQTVVLEHARGTSWLEVGRTTTSATVQHTTADGVELYGWSLPRVLPAAAWTAGTTGFFAKVRMRVPGAGTNGSDFFMYTFRPDWSSCYEQYPETANFISYCSSPRSPHAFIYTRDFPAGVDLVITSLLWTSTGRTEVRVRNNGRPGKLVSVTCSRFGSSSVFTVNEPILPGETKSILNAVAPSGSVTCTASGTNEDGSPEANTANNSRSQTF